MGLSGTLLTTRKRKGRWPREVPLEEARRAQGRELVLVEARLLRLEWRSNHIPTDQPRRLLEALQVTVTGNLLWQVFCHWPKYRRYERLSKGARRLASGGQI